jgi:hypothetical protein
MSTLDGAGLAAIISATAAVLLALAELIKAISRARRGVPDQPFTQPPVVAADPDDKGGSQT